MLEREHTRKVIVSKIIRLVQSIVKTVLQLENVCSSFKLQAVAVEKYLQYDVKTAEI